MTTTPFRTRWQQKEPGVDHRPLAESRWRVGLPPGRWLRERSRGSVPTGFPRSSTRLAPVRVRLRSCLSIPSKSPGLILSGGNVAGVPHSVELGFGRETGRFAAQPSKSLADTSFIPALEVLPQTGLRHHVPTGSGAAHHGGSRALDGCGRCASARVAHHPGACARHYAHGRAAHHGVACAEHYAHTRAAHHACAGVLAPHRRGTGRRATEGGGSHRGRGAEGYHACREGAN